MYDRLPRFNVTMSIKIAATFSPTRLIADNQRSHAVDGAGGESEEGHPVRDRRNKEKLRNHQLSSRSPEEFERRRKKVSTPASASALSVSRTLFRAIIHETCTCDVSANICF